MNFQKEDHPNDEQGLAGLGLLLNTTYRLEVAMKWGTWAGSLKIPWVIKASFRYQVQADDYDALIEYCLVSREESISRD